MLKYTHIKRRIFISIHFLIQDKVLTERLFGCQHSIVADANSIIFERRTDFDIRQLLRNTCNIIGQISESQRRALL
jgi:hypothetical protein